MKITIEESNDQLKITFDEQFVLEIAFADAHRFGLIIMDKARFAVNSHANAQQKAPHEGSIEGTINVR